MSDPFVFRIGHLGDTLAAIPALRAISKQHERRLLTLITHSPAQANLVTAWDVLKHTGLFGRVLYYDLKRPLSLVRLAREIRRARNPLLYYLVPSQRQGRLRDWLFFRVLCGAGMRGMSPQADASLKGSDGKLLKLPREFERLLDIFAGQQLRGDATRPPLLVRNADARRKVDVLLGDWAHLPLIALGIGSKMPSKKWPFENFVEIANRILTHYPESRIIVAGGNEDRADGAKLVAALGSDRVSCVAGELDIGESADLLSRCIVYVGNDTGTMHLAASTGVRCIGIFSSRDNPGRWEPFGDGHVVLRRDLDCSGCMLTECVERRMECLRLISVDDVWQAVAPALQTSIGGPKGVAMPVHK